MMSQALQHKGNYDHVRCSVCGLPWQAPVPERAHGSECPRDRYRPPVRRHPDGTDVTATPERWGFADHFFPAPDPPPWQPPPPEPESESEPSAAAPARPLTMVRWAPEMT